MSNRRTIILVNLAILIALTAVACGPTSPTVTPTPALPTSEGSIDVGGYKLNYQCFGQGSPTVVVEAGSGDKPVVSYTWRAVTQEVQTITRICIYDRALGIRTSQDAAEDLHFLLNKIPIPGPYILVGHSIGGLHVRVFAHLYPEDVAGMILVDSTVPESPTAFATVYPTYSPDENPALADNRISDVNATLSPNMLSGLDLEASAEQVRQAGSLGDLPLIVISQSDNADNWAVPGFAAEDAQRASATWQKLQADLATLSSKGVFMTAKTSGHFIPTGEPQIIVDAITQMVEEIRKQ